MRHLSVCQSSRASPPPASLYQRAAQLAGVGGWECDLTTGELTWTDAVYDMFGLPVGSPPTRSKALALYSDQSRADVELLRARAIGTGQGFTLDAELCFGRGVRRWIRLTAEIAHDAGRAACIFGAKQDITLQQEALARLRRLGERDALTGLANRGVFDAQFNSLIETPEIARSVAVLILIDIDHFKQINDSHGHAAGDECLRAVAARLRNLFGDALLIARIGGDEFAILLRTPMPPLAIARRLRQASTDLGRPFLWNNLLVEMQASIGARLLVYPHLPHPKLLFMEADEALYAAKAAGRNRIEIFGIAHDPRGAAAADRDMVENRDLVEKSGRLDRDPPGLVRAASFRT